jgi:hypothetical protein
MIGVAIGGWVGWKRGWPGLAVLLVVGLILIAIYSHSNGTTNVAASLSDIPGAVAACGEWQPPESARLINRSAGGEIFQVLCGPNLVPVEVAQ